MWKVKEEQRGQKNLEDLVEKEFFRVALGREDTLC